MPGEQRGARFSPDGRWVAYQSTESGQEEVYIRPWPDLDAKYLVSSGNGTEPVWSPDGREVFYRDENRVMAISVSATGDGLELGVPRILFSGAFAYDESGDQSWDIGPDGRFLMIRPVPGGRPTLQVALNWLEGVRARLAEGR